MYLHLAFRDVLFNVINCLLLLMLLMIFMIQENKSEQTPSVEMGSIVATIVWPNGDNDVDIWSNGPGEPKPVGYSNKGGANLDLLRDDMGNVSDVLPMNYENVVSRSLVEGEYTFNLHCYRCETYPVDVALEIRINRGNGTPPYVLNRTFRLTNADEMTAINFRMNALGVVDHDSINETFVPLRAEQ